MPAFYAHDSFGMKVSNEIEGDLKYIIQKYNRQFEIGLQGPDIFFFYKAYKDNEVSQYGNHLHAVSAYPFFEHAVEVIKEKGRKSREYAYLLGFICHFILDSECHPYMDEMIKKTGIQHIEIEEEFEKKMLRIDNRDALGYPVGDLVPTDRMTAEAIVPFYNGMDFKKVRASLKYLKLIKKLFTAPGARKQDILNTAMKVTGKYGKWKGLMNQRIDNPTCKESNVGLLKRFQRAIPIAVDAIYSYDNSLRTGKELDSRFDRTFE